MNSRERPQITSFSSQIIEPFQEVLNVQENHFEVAAYLATSENDAPLPLNKEYGTFVMTQLDSKTGITKHYKMKNCESNVDFKNSPQTSNNGAYCTQNDLFLSGVDKKDQITFQLAFYSC